MADKEPGEKVPEQFSYANAVLAAEELFNALPKTRRPEYIGELNEVLVVMGEMFGALAAGTQGPDRVALERKAVKKVIEERNT